MAILSFTLLCFVFINVARGSNQHMSLKRIIGGDHIERGRWPWLASLTGTIPTKTVLGVTVESRKLYCGASLIKPNWAVSAAHCFPEGGNLPREKILKPSNWKVRLGHKGHEASIWAKMKDKAGKTLNVQALRDWDVKVEKIIIHPAYSSADLWANDIVLLKLVESIPDDLKDRIRPVTLPVAKDSSFPADGQDCYLQGWGCTEAGGSVTEKGKEVVLPKVSDAECAGLWHISTTGRLCAGYDLAAKGICPGDSGGPLVCKKDDDWVQVGIASFTSRDHPDKVPGAFTRLSQYTDWVEETIRNN